MVFPDLVAIAEGVLHSENTGVPSNGVNTFAIGLDPEKIDNTDWSKVDVFIGGSVTGASSPTISPDKTQLTISFTQTGTDTATVRFTHIHSGVR